MPKLNNEQMARCEALAKRTLERAYVLLSDKTRWTKGTIARDRFDRTLGADDPDAAKWCAMGALAVSAKQVMLEAEEDEFETYRVVTCAEHLLLPHLRDIASVTTPQERLAQDPGYLKLAGVPQFNDNPLWGYPLIIAGFASATGNTVSDTIARSVERVRRLRAAALKGWETRRRKEQERWAAYKASQPTTFGGTINQSTSEAPAAERKEVAV